MINFVAHASGGEHPHVGNSQVPTSLYIILGITLVAIVAALIAASLLSKKSQTATEETDEDA
jgi:flagellar basal body-associated protein FliL